MNSVSIHFLSLYDTYNCVFIHNRYVVYIVIFVLSLYFDHKLLFIHDHLVILSKAWGNF